MKKGNITGGLILVLLGVWFLAVQFVPSLNAWAEGKWSLSIIGLGVIFLLVSILTSARGFSIPAFIVGGIGGILYYQNVTGDWDSWAYIWTLIPGFVGLGLLFFSLQIRDKGTRRAGFTLVFLSMIFFAVFGSFLGAPEAVVQYWPILLVLAGLWSMSNSLFGKGNAEPQQSFGESIEEAMEDLSNSVEEAFEEVKTEFEEEFHSDKSDAALSEEDSAINNGDDSK